MPPIQAIIPVTPGSGLDLDAVSLTIGLNTVYREVLVIADPSNATYLATVTSGGALNVAEATLDGCITANVLAVSLPSAQITTLTPPSAAAIAAAIVANPPAVTVSGSVGVTQSTSPWVVAGGGTAGAAATGVVTVQGIAAMTPLLVTATFSAPQHVIVDSGTLTTVSTVTAVTSITNPVAVTGTFFQATQPVSVASGQVASGAFASGSIASGAIASGAIASGAIAAGAAAAGAFADGSVFVRSNAASTFPVTAVGTLTHNNAAPTTNNIGALVGVASTAAPTYTTGDQVLLSTDLAGNLRTTGTFTGAVTGTLTNNNAAPGATNVGTLPAVANAAAQTWTEGDQVALSEDLSGNLRVISESGSTTAVTQATASNLNAAVVGTKTNNNAAPGATNVGVLPAIANAATQTWTEGDLVLESVDLSGRQRIMGQVATAATFTGSPLTVSGVDAGGLVRTLPVVVSGGTTPANTLVVGGFSAGGGTALQMSVNSSGAVQIAGQGVVPADANANAVIQIPSAGGTNGYFGNLPFVFNGATWDRQRSATIGNAVAATGIAAHAAYGEYLSTAPAPTTGQYSALQTDNAGSLFTKNTRRSQTAAQGTTISSTTSATAVTATPAAATFADLSQLIITVTPIAVTAIAFTATLSDGTNTYIYDLDTGVTASGGGDLLVVNFNPPLPATSAATGWTIALSVNTVVAHVTTIVILQKAS